VRLIYHITDAARRRIFVETGRDPGQVQSLEADPAQLSVEDRQLLVAHDPSLSGQLYLTLPAWRNGSAYNDYLALESVLDDAAQLLAVYRDARATAEAAYVEGREASLVEQIARYSAYDLTWSSKPSLPNDGPYRESPRLGELRAAYDALQDRIKERDRERAERKRADEAELAAAKAAREHERADWIAAHGSPRLRKCLEGGYNCQRLYVLERAALEHPGYTVDFDDKAAWKDRSGPSEAAMDEARRVDGIVVWLTAFPVDDGNAEEYQESWEEATEAVVVRGYLGKYDLVRIGPFAPPAAADADDMDPDDADDPGYDRPAGAPDSIYR